MAEKTIEIKDLVVEYRTRSGVVQALNGLSLSIERERPWALWERQELERLRPAWQYWD